MEFRYAELPTVDGFLGQSPKSTHRPRSLRETQVEIPGTSEKVRMNNLNRNKAVAFRKFFLSATASFRGFHQFWRS